MGHKESVYHKALTTSLSAANFKFRSEVFAPIMFMGQVVGMGRCDIIVGNLIIELKAIAYKPKRTSNQIKKYITSLSEAERTKYRGVIINFNQKNGGIDVVELPLCQPAASQSKPLILRPKGMLEKLKNSSKLQR
jgi:GxxExxY protein